MNAEQLQQFAKQNGHHSTLAEVQERFTAREANVLVRVFNVNKSAGGIIMPKAFISTPGRYAEVVSCGPGPITSAGTLVPMELSPGDIVVLRPNAGIEVKLRLPGTPEAESFLIMSCHEILLKFNLGVDGIIE